MSTQVVRVGMIGLGTVGTGVVKILQQRAEMLAHQLGARIEIGGVAVRDTGKLRDVALPNGVVTNDPASLVRRGDLDIVIELMGGTSDAKRHVLDAIEHGKHIVTANKALIALEGRDVFAAAYRKGVGVYLEASVAGGIPIIKALHEGLAANEIEGIYGILNGTCNYILTQMTEHGQPFADALADAQRLGYAEADPTFDVDGFDTAHKIAILSSLAYGFNVNIEEVYVEGIRRIGTADIQYAHELGYTMKLLAISKRKGGSLNIRVHPVLVPESSVLANVKGAFNAVAVIGDAVGPTLFYGKGAGMMPTASAVVADLLDAARTVVSKAPAEIPVCYHPERAITVPIESMDSTVSRYYLRLQVLDQPGVLAEITAILGRHEISVAAIIQKEPHCEGSVPLVLLTHDAMEKSLQSARREIDALDCMRDESVCIRVETDV
ncbi:MAG: homoserine dehydrogenase [Candidatus Poribacteria bacterium]|nr:homoserine dehydrogenase [Candidatus Poribacteria bacterium]